MAQHTRDQNTDSFFPPAPVPPSRLLSPITTRADALRETDITGVEFEQCWHDSVRAGDAYFFRWLGEPRATVLVVWDSEGPLYIEGRKSGNVLVSAEESERIIAEVVQLFQNSGTAAPQ